MQTNNFDLYEVENMAVQDAYALLVANIHFVNEKSNNSIRTLTICSYDTKVGKTTTAINLSISMARSGWKVLLVDADIRKPDSYKRLNDNTGKGLSDYIENDDNLQEVLNSTNIPNLCYLPCGRKSHNPIGLFCSAKFDAFITEIRGEYDFIIFDSPALSTVIDSALIATKTDATILVAQIGLSDEKSLARAKEQLSKADAFVMGVVLTKVRKREFKKYVESYNYFDHLTKKVVKDKEYDIAVSVTS